MAAWSGLLTLMLIIFSAITGLLIFTKGFLLNRVAVTNTSHTSPSFTLQPQYKKVVLVVIDALRYDFVAPQESDSYHHNKLPFVQTLLTQYPQQTRLYRFIADPPTTTMQRLKGLTTGGLPTFVDAGSNFASSEISEDNIIQQLVNNNKSIVFMGDDTWESLFHGRFIRSYPFPSFNVHDLHTVDRGVKKHLLPEMATKDYSLLIAHFLGVDHCGHRYSPDHPAMADKLSEMNDVLRSVVDSMDNDTLLVVMGDHGMTKTGDHGGESELEVNAALFLYTKRPGVWSPQQMLEEVSQIDLVPTLSLLLGVPIPYSNLGTLITEVMSDHKAKNSDRILLQALSANQHQISNYLRHYNEISNDLPKPEMAVLSEIENNLATLSTSTVLDVRLTSRYLQYMSKAKEMCRSVWAKFDINLMLIGCLQVLFTIILHTFSSLGIIHPSSDYILCLFQVSLTLTSLVLCYLAILPLYSMVILTFLFTLGVVCCLSNDSKIASISTVDALAVVSLIALGLCSLSNSLLVYEDRASYYLVQSVLVLIWLSHTMSNLKQEVLRLKERSPRPSTYLWRVTKTTSFFVLLSLSFILKLSQIFRSCREEQEGCEVPLLLTPLSSLHEELNTYKNLRFWLMSLPAAMLPVLTIRRTLTVRGHLNGYSPLTLLSIYALPTMSLLVILDWVAGNSALLQDWQRTIFARAVYILFISVVVATFAWPKAVYYAKNRTRTVAYNGSISSLYNYMKQNINDKSTEESCPLIYGLGTAYSAAYMILSTALALVLMMIAGDGMALSLCLLLFVLYVFLELQQKTCHQYADIPICNVICWFLLSKYFFYGTGQQQTITSIRWDAAFHGFAQDHDSHVIPAILLFSSTLSSQVIFTLMLPLLLIVTQSQHFFYQSLLLSSSRSLAGVAEVTLAQREQETDQKLLRLFIIYLLSHLSKSFFSLCSAALLRRHLMVWKIFAPAFIYEGASFIVTSLLAVISYILFIRISQSVQRYIKDFNISHIH